jgi:hypothetical protein
VLEGDSVGEIKERSKNKKGNKGNWKNYRKARGGKGIKREKGRKEEHREKTEEKGKEKRKRREEEMLTVSGKGVRVNRASRSFDEQQHWGMEVCGAQKGESMVLKRTVG